MNLARRLVFAAGIFFISAGTGLAYHPEHEIGRAGENSAGAASYDAILPIVFVVIIFMAVAVLWGRKKPGRKSRAKPQTRRKRVKSKKRRR